MPRSKRTSKSTKPAHKLTPAPTEPAQKPEEDKNLTAWLVQQAENLKDLGAKGRSLKLDFVANAREQGRILLEVKKRLETTRLRFQDWVEEGTDLGYSTALLWMDVAQNYDKVKERFADSNPLERTVRQVRNAIRDDRQAQGKGKPGSGKKKAATSPKKNHHAEAENGPSVKGTKGSEFQSQAEDELTATPETATGRKQAVDVSANDDQSEEGAENPLDSDDQADGDEERQDTLVIRLTPDNFEDTLESGPVLIHFWTEGCALCRKLVPIFKALAEALPLVTFTTAEIDPDACLELAGRFSIGRVPTLVLIDNGEEIARRSGSDVTQEQLQDWLDDNLSGEEGRPEKAQSRSAAENHASDAPNAQTEPLHHGLAPKPATLPNTTHFHHDCHNFKIDGNSLECLDQKGQTVILVAPKGQHMADLLGDALGDGENTKQNSQANKKRRAAK